MDFNIPDYVNKILNKIEDAGFEAFIVGGSVRDLVIGKEPSDYDVTTSATPDEISSIFNDFKTIYVGKQFGTVIIIQQEGTVEVTTYRTEGEYIDGRRPTVVSFSKDIYEDLSRRDFTINSMAYNKHIGIIDPFHGKIDIENKIIRTVGNPEARFKEDHLRILRAVRFSTQLGFDLEEDTYKACKKLSDSLKYISTERIRDELFKILISSKPSKGIRLMLELGILDVVIPEIIETVDYDQRNPNHKKILFDHILCVLDNTKPVIEIRMAALLHDIAKPLTFSIDEKGVGHYYNHDTVGAGLSKDILIRLRCSNLFVEKVTKLIKEHMHYPNMKDKGIKRQLRRVGEEDIFDLFDLKKADMKCKDGKKDVGILLEQEEQIRRILNSNEPYHKNHLNINGNDIISLGYKENKAIGEILDYLMEKVLENPKLNEKDKLIEMAIRKVNNEQ